MSEVKFLALVKQFSKRQLASLDSELQIVLRTNDISIIPQLNELSKADEMVTVSICNE